VVYAVRAICPLLVALVFLVVVVLRQVGLLTVMVGPLCCNRS
jgi:hypothetical protein